MCKSSPEKCSVEGCPNKKIYDEKKGKFLPICGYDCFIKGKNLNMF